MKSSYLLNALIVYNPERDSAKNDMIGERDTVSSLIISL